MKRKDLKSQKSNDIATINYNCCDKSSTNVSSSVTTYEISADEEKLFDYTEWEQYRDNVKHPCLAIKITDINLANENIRRYKWARDYAAIVENNARYYQSLITPDFLAKMIEETTPGDPLWTPCPSCRDQGKPVHPHGLWIWEVENPDQIKCEICGAIFPNDRYPEDIVLHTTLGRDQTISYCGSNTFPIFGYLEGRPSFTANIRSRKVQWMANYCFTLAEAYILTGNSQYAATCRNILLRFADCYPNWLVHVGYGEYADINPHISSRNIHNLPEPEICPPPNLPKRSLFTGFWSAGRATGAGLESCFIRKLVEAYDLTCSASDLSGDPIYTEQEKKLIEKDLLLESTVLLVCDKSVNNKSASNRTAVALVGMCVGQPGLVRFGLEGFNKTVDGLFYRDGTSSESPFYGLMTLAGIWDMAQAARGYSDPPGYKDIEEKRIDSLDLYHNTQYHRIWDAFFKSLQGDLHFPPYADSFRGSGIDTSYVELMVANYPERTEYLSLLKELCGVNLAAHSGSTAAIGNHNSDIISDTEPFFTLPYYHLKPAGYLSFSLYFREPGLESRNASKLKLSDWFPPVLQIGHLRTGYDGRESLLLMNGSHWGIHHEKDSLNIYYWKKGYEVLSDLGYLWDNPHKHLNIRSLAHNTVLVDEKDQTNYERGGDVLFFEKSEHVKALEMSSEAYPEASIYQRTSAIIDHGNGQNYVVDFFRVEGGKKQDYIFHIADNRYEVLGIELQSLSDENLYDFKNIRSGNGAATWRTKWKSGRKLNCMAWSMGQQNEQIYVADGWGQRDWKNSDIGAIIPYIVRRCHGNGMKTFISVFEGYETNDPFINDIKIVDPKGIISVETILGTDYIMSMPDCGIFYIGTDKNRINLSGHFVAASLQNKKLAWNFKVPENENTSGSKYR